MKRSKTFLTKAAMLLIVALFSLTGARAQQALPYTYGFENNNLTTDGWVLQGASNSGINTNAKRSGRNGFRFQWSERNAHLMSPILTGGELGVSVSFWYKESSSSWGDEQFQVGYTADETNTDASTFTYGDVVTASTSWQEYSNFFPAGTKRIAVKYIYNDAFYLYLDDFSFESMSTLGPVVISGDPEPEFTGSTYITITDGAEGATILYSIDEGYSWKTYDGGFELNKTAMVIAKQTKEDMEDGPETEKFFLNSSDRAEFLWDLATNPSSYTTKTADNVHWICTGATMDLARGSGNNTTPANQYLGGTNGYIFTRFYNRQTLTIKPVNGFAITSIEITAAAYVDNLNTYMSLTNAEKTVSGNVVTITPIDDSQPIVATFSNADYYQGWNLRERPIQVTGVNVNYYATSSPFIAIATMDEKVNVTTSAEVPTTTLETHYNKVDESSADAVLCDENGNEVSYDWITVGLNGDKNLTYKITTPNTTLAERIAYVKITGNRTYPDNEGNPVVVSSPIIQVTQAKPYTVTVSKVGYTTFVAPADVKFPDPLVAYIVYAQTGTSVKLSERASVPAGTPVVVKTEETLTETKEYALLLTTEPADVTGNLLQADKEDFAPGDGERYKYYCLANKSSRGVGFYPVAVGVTIPAGKAYLVDTSTPAKEFLGFDFDDPTGIDDVNVNLNDNDAIYNLAGQRLQKMQKGINIVNGKKIMVK